MDGVLATAVGPKLVNGRRTGDRALHFVVAEKLPLSHIEVGSRIPRYVEGLTTDVLRSEGEMALDRAVLPAIPAHAACGSGIVTALGRIGTLGSCAVTLAGAPAAITAAHVVARNDQAYLEAAGGNLLFGPLLQRVTSALGNELYGSRARNPNERFAVDLTVLSPRAFALTGGLVGQSFVVASDTGTILPWIEGAGVVSLGAGSRGWRQGVVVGLWPRRGQSRKLTGFCLVEESVRSVDGDSGSTWFAPQPDGFVAVGNHWGQVRGYAFLTDLTAGARLCGIDQFLTRP